MATRVTTLVRAESTPMRRVASSDLSGRMLWASAWEDATTSDATATSVRVT
jgi:hypothetical protein